MKFLDMPPDNGANRPYEALLAQVRRGRVAALVPIRHPNGLPGLYILSAKPEGELTKDNSHKTCVMMAVRARHAAECEEYVVD